MKIKFLVGTLIAVFSMSIQFPKATCSETNTIAFTHGEDSIRIAGLLSLSFAPNPLKEKVPRSEKPKNKSYANYGFVQTGLRFSNYRFQNFMIGKSEYTDQYGKQITTKENFYYDAEARKVPLFVRIDRFEGKYIYWNLDIAGSVGGKKIELDVQKNQFVSENSQIKDFETSSGKLWGSSAFFSVAVGSFIKYRWGLYGGIQYGYNTAMPMDINSNTVPYTQPKIGGKGPGWSIHAFAPMFSGLFKFSFIKDYYKTSPQNKVDMAKAQSNTAEFYWLIPLDHKKRNYGFAISYRNQNITTGTYSWKNLNQNRDLIMNVSSFQFGLIVTNIVGAFGKKK